MGHWRTLALGDLCRIEIGGTPARKSPKMWDPEKKTDNVWLSIADLPQTLKALVFDSKEYISDEALKKAKPVREGTLLVSFKLTLGRLAFAGRNLFTNEAIAALTISDHQVITNTYLYWYLTYFDWDKAAEGSHKIKGKTLNKAKLNLLPVLVPLLPEQERIVEILDEAFAAIETAIANAEKNLANAREMFESELNRIFSQKWERTEGRAFKELYHVRSSKRVLKSQWKSEGVPFYRGREITRLSKDGYVDNELFISEGDYEKYASRYGVPAPGDIVITAIGTIGNSYVVQERDRFYFKDASVLWLQKCSAIVRSDFINLWLKSQQFFSQLDEGNGATVDTLTINRLKSVHVDFPSLSDQARIVAGLDKLSAKKQLLIEIFEQKADLLSNLKQSLLHKAFTGELTADSKAADRTLSEAGL